jgi:hypothetical protein
VEYGNQRVSKFAPDGTFILSFGKKGNSTVPYDDSFPGFLSPTGIACGDGRVYVADEAQKCIYQFDENGRYLGFLVNSGLEQPEGLYFKDSQHLIVADTSRIVSVDTSSGIITELARGAAHARLTDARPGANGSLLAANFAGDEVLVETPISQTASGLFVTISRVDAGAFPQVTVELRVQDSRRRPITGLDSLNFLLTENHKNVVGQTLRYQGFANNTTAYSLVMEHSAQTVTLQDDLTQALHDSATALGSPVSFISAGKEALRATSATITRGNYANGGQWNFDQSIRLAAGDLLGLSAKKALVFVGTPDGVDKTGALDRYALSELASFLANNDIRFYAVTVGSGEGNGDVLSYLATVTGGQVLPLYQSSGIGPGLSSLKSAASSLYTFSYTSQLPTNYGRAYLPIEAEVYLMERSGRDETGYYPPLE